MRVIRIQGRLAQRGAMHFQLGDGLPFVALDQGQVGRAQAGQVFGQRGFGCATQLAHDGHPVGRGEHHFGRAGAAHARAVLVRRFEHDIVVAVLDDVHAQAA